MVGGSLLFVGCSDSTTTSGGYVDPGGTFGAELTVIVRGRGRVITKVPGLDCPSDCFSKTIFASATADGAAGGIGLKAIPTPGTKFLGWSFETDPVGTRGKGPEACNPITRPGSQPSVDTTAVEITLPFGEVAGTAPAGKEGTCAAYLNVPLVYRVVANFEGADVNDAGDGGDGGAGEILYEAPTGFSTSSSQGDLGIVNGQLFWRYATTTGYHGILTGPTGGGVAAQTVLNPASSYTVSQFEVDSSGLVYQTSSGVYFASSNAPTTVLSLPFIGTCSAVAADSTENVYCRMGTQLYRWSAPAYAQAQVLFTSMSTGSDLVVESAVGDAYFTSTSSIQSLPLLGADGGVASPTTIVSSSLASNLESNTTYLWWLSSGQLYRSSKTALSTATPAGVPGTVTKIAPDPSTSTIFWAATSSSIYRASYLGSSSTVLFKSGLSTILGVAADNAYVYWLQSDGRVRRALKL